MHIESTATVGSAKALGAALTIDDQGFHVVSILGIPAPPPVLLDSLTNQIAQALGKLGLQVRLVQGASVDGPADGTTSYEAIGAGLEVNVPFTIPASIPIPSTPIPLGIPVGAGVPTNITVALGRAKVDALAGKVAGFGSSSSAAPSATTSSAGSLGSGSMGGVTSGRAATSGATPSAAPIAAPAVSRAVVPAAAHPDLLPAFRWTLLTAISVLVLGWPIARRRIAGVPGLSAAQVLASFTRAGGSGR